MLIWICLIFGGLAIAAALIAKGELEDEKRKAEEEFRKWEERLKEEGHF